MKETDIKKYESLCRYRRMSSAQFIEEVMGIRLLWYQKAMLYMLDVRDRLEKKYMPHRYYWRHFSR